MGALVVAVPTGLVLGAVARDDNDIEIWKSPTCGCCGNWVTHMRTNGFRPVIHDVEDVSPIKRQHGVPVALESCHTGIVGGYAIEGHVPADVVRALLKQRPAVLGIAVPGMPVGSPGMEMGGRRDKYDVIAFTKAGTTSVFAKR